MFITDGISMKFVIRENATTYEVLHELMHFRDCMKTGKEAFYKKPLLDREKYVYDKIIEYRKYVNRRELIHAEDYINEHLYKARKTDKVGNPIVEVLPFNVNDIPKKRQKVNLNKIINLK